MSLMMMMLFLTATTFAQKTIWADDFANDLAPWTTQDKSIKKKKDIWVYSKVGPIGQFKIPTIKSATATNGFALFDSDSYCSHSQDAWLTSPTIDCSTNKTAVLFFAQQYRKYQDSTFVMVSVDNGTNWTSIKVNGTLGDTDPLDENPTVSEIDLTSIIANKAQVKIAFRFLSDSDSNPDAGCAYSWMIDDVKLVEKPRNNLALGDFLFGPANYATPSSQIEGDVMPFGVDVKNKGIFAQPNVKLKVRIAKVTDNTALTVEKTIYTDSLTFSTIGTDIGATKDSTFSFAKKYTAGKLVEGLYEVRYSIASKDSIDFNLADNSKTAYFRVSKATFSKENVPTNAFRFSGDEAVGNLFTMSKNWGTSKFVATNAYFAAASDAADPLVGKNVNFYVFKVSDAILPDFSNFDDQSDLTNNKDLEIVGISNYTYPDTADDYKIMKVNLEDFATNKLGVNLVAGKRYILMASYEGDANTIYPAYGRRIKYFETPEHPVSTLLFTDQWYTGGSGVGNAATMRMEIALATTADETPLAETVLQLSPNPATSFVNVDLNFEKPVNASIILADITGKVIDTQDVENVKSKQVQMSTEGLANGIYLIRVSTNEGTKTKKFVVQR